MHRELFVHRDIKPDNIFFADGSVLVVGDVGLARQLVNDTSTIKDGLALCVGYLPPEAIPDMAVNRAHDMWGLGMMALDMLNGSHCLCQGRLPLLYRS